MTNTIIHVGDVDTVIRLTITEADGVTPVDVSIASVKTFYFLKPSGEKMNAAAAFNTTGVDGKLKYNTIAGDIDEAGVWRVQAYVELVAPKKYYSAVATFTAESNLA